MAIRAFSADPAALLAKLKKAVSPTGDAETWHLDAKQNFVHSPDQWAKAGAFQASVQKEYVQFLWANGTESKPHAFEYLHGRFAEFLMRHGGSAVAKVNMWDARKKT